VLAVPQLDSASQKLFTAKTVPGQVQLSGPAIPEPHGSWVEPLEKEWLRRYAA
jgi:putative thiamine transport system substrate-binding protein